MDTKKISLIPTERDYIANAVIGRIPQTVESQVRLFDPLIKKLLSVLGELWVKISNRSVWFNTAVSGIFPDLDLFEPSKQNVFFSFAETKFIKSFEGFDGNLMTLPELRASGVEKLSKFSGKLFAFKDGGLTKAYDPTDGTVYGFNTANHHEAVCIPSLRFTRKNGLPLAGEELIMVLLDKELVPAGLTPAEEDSFYDLIRLNKSDRGYMGLSPEGHIFFDCEKLSGDIAAGTFAGSVNGLDFSMDTLLAVTRIKADEDFSKALKISLLSCEKRRADIDPYDEKLLSDPNRGHWELWSNEGGDPPYAIEISEPLIARNPLSDVDRDGIIAIDFGTKSTVVVYQKSSEHTLPMAIGTGRLADAGKAEHYENPTVMEFADMATFLSKYYSRTGRPETLWENLPISHTAYSDMKNSASRDYYSFFCDLKQWAGEGSYPLRICDRSGGEYLLPPYMSGEAADFDPIELYAYYIGLYINNMRNGIFLDYYLSFPVTFEKSVRERITASFERGLMKSLPPSILENEEVMADFRVDGSVSEPAAYAVCALKEYGVFPEEGEEFHYGTFDFGGGTADFDFGVCRTSDKRKFDYTIENYGAGGDRYLGGENLLELLSVTVFRDNYDKIAEKGITFTLPPRCPEFAGSAAVVARSKEAEANMRHMMEHLRPLWENTEGFADEFQRGIICVDLFDRNGELIPRFELEVSAEKLVGIIKDNISRGIDNFFSSMSLAYTAANASVPDRVNIMLAGNSCRNKLVSELFEEKFAEGAEKLRKALDTDREFEFVLYPPLGTEEACRLMESRGIDPHRGSLERPTGKTGVAFGLIMCRKGGVIERKALSAKEEEIPFKYFIGFNKRGRFTILSDENAPMTLSGKPDYNVWYNFTDADEDTFEIFYTPLPEAVTNSLPIEQVMKKKCRLNVVYEKACVFVRASGPKTIQYVAATENGINFDTYLGKIMTVELD
ncbi:hypothetical protein [Huintestinicola sp.]|uniref:hypothetical protein n=1 Tax=Huintestinicola sp. TaxID=2981661 RepID=UPI003D7C6FE2